MLSCPYEAAKARLVLREMADQLSLELVEKGLVTDQVVLTVGYDIENLTDPARRTAYSGPVEQDRYGRRVPKAAHGAQKLDAPSSSTRRIMEAASALFDRIVDGGLLVRRMYLVAAHIVPEDEAQPEEMEQLKDLLERELKAGAFGMSLGLIYPPSAFCKSEELVELAKVLKKYDALLTVHMRNEGPRIFQAVDEMLDITRRSGVHLQISHLKLMGKPQWGRSQELLDKIEAARQEGMTITCDQYPYTATSTSMTALLPKWAHDGGVSALVARVKAPDQRLKDETAAEMEDRDGPAHVMVLRAPSGYHPEWEGRTVAELAEELGLSPVDTVMHVLSACEGSVACIYFCWGYVKKNF